MKKLHAKNDLPDLVRYLDDALSLTERLIPSIKYSEEDHLGFIIPTFLCKLEEQALSVQILVSNDHGRDAELIARSMLETMVTALWIAQDPGERGFKWRGFAYIEDWRLARERPEISIDPREKQARDDFIQKYGSIYEDPKKRYESDPYHHNWRGGVSVRRMFEDVKGDILYKDLYSSFSEWIHAGPRSIGLAIERQGGTIKWKPAPPSANATVLTVAFQAIVEVLRLAVKHFKSEMEDEVNHLIDQSPGT